MSGGGGFHDPDLVELDVTPSGRSISKMPALSSPKSNRRSCFDRSISSVRRCGECKSNDKGRCRRFKTKFRYFYHHPYLSLLTAISVTLTCALYYPLDPQAYSDVDVNLPLIGTSINVIFGKFPSPTSNPGWVFMRVCLIMLSILFAFIVGELLLRRLILRDLFGLKAFQGNEGALVCTIPTLIVFLTISSVIFNNAVLKDRTTEVTLLNWTGNSEAGKNDLVRSLIGSDLPIASSTYAYSCFVLVLVINMFTIMLVIDSRLQDTVNYKRCCSRCKRRDPRGNTLWTRIRILTFWTWMLLVILSITIHGLTIARRSGSIKDYWKGELDVESDDPEASPRCPNISTISKNYLFGRCSRSGSNNAASTENLYTKCLDCNVWRTRGDHDTVDINNNNSCKVSSYDSFSVDSYYKSRGPTWFSDFLSAPIYLNIKERIAGSSNEYTNSSSHSTGSPNWHCSRNLEIADFLTHHEPPSSVPPSWLMTKMRRPSSDSNIAKDKPSTTSIGEIPLECATCESDSSCGWAPSRNPSLVRTLTELNESGVETSSKDNEAFPTTGVIWYDSERLVLFYLLATLLLDGLLCTMDPLFPHFDPNKLDPINKGEICPSDDPEEIGFDDDDNERGTSTPSLSEARLPNRYVQRIPGLNVEELRMPNVADLKGCLRAIKVTICRCYRRIRTLRWRGQINNDGEASGCCHPENDNDGDDEDDSDYNMISATGRPSAHNVTDDDIFNTSESQQSGSGDEDSNRDPAVHRPSVPVVDPTDDRKVLRMKWLLLGVLFLVVSVDYLSLLAFSMYKPPELDQLVDRQGYVYTKLHPPTSGPESFGYDVDKTSSGSLRYHKLYEMCPILGPPWPNRKIKDWKELTVENLLGLDVGGELIYEVAFAAFGVTRKEYMEAIQSVIVDPLQVPSGKTFSSSDFDPNRSGHYFPDKALKISNLLGRVDYEIDSTNDYTSETLGDVFKVFKWDEHYVLSGYGSVIEGSVWSNRSAHITNSTYNGTFVDVALKSGNPGDVHIFKASRCLCYKSFSLRNDFVEDDRFLKRMDSIYDDESPDTSDGECGYSEGGGTMYELDGLWLADKCYVGPYEGSLNKSSTTTETEDPTIKFLKSNVFLQRHIPGTIRCAESANYEMKLDRETLLNVLHIAGIFSAYSQVTLDLNSIGSEDPILDLVNLYEWFHSDTIDNVPLEEERTFEGGSDDDSFTPTSSERYNASKYQRIMDFTDFRCSDCIRSEMIRGNKNNLFAESNVRPLDLRLKYMVKFSSISGKSSMGFYLDDKVYPDMTDAYSGGERDNNNDTYSHHRDGYNHLDIRLSGARCVTTTGKRLIRHSDDDELAKMAYCLVGSAFIGSLILWILVYFAYASLREWEKKRETVHDINQDSGDPPSRGTAAKKIALKFCRCIHCDLQERYKIVS